MSAIKESWGLYLILKTFVAGNFYESDYQVIEQETKTL